MSTRIHFLILLIGLCVARKTKFLGVVSRHGARHTFYADLPPNIQGELTNNGLRMSYFLGKYLKQTYSTFFPEKFNLSNNYIISSESSRCRKTAQAIMMGIYGAGSQSDSLKEYKKEYLAPEWDGARPEATEETALPLGATPVPIHAFVTGENQAFLGWFDWECPKVYSRISKEDPKETEEMLKVMNGLLPKLINDKFDYRKITKKEKFDTIHDWGKIPDYVLSRKNLGDDSGLDEEIHDQLIRLHASCIYYIYLRDPVVNKYLFTEHARILLKELEEVNSRIKAGEKDINRFLLMSGHDLNIILYLMSANLVKTDCATPGGQCTVNPPYSSALTFEVYEDEGKHFVETVLNGEYMPLCATETGQRCSLEEFIVVLRSRTEHDDIHRLRELHCKSKPDNVDPGTLLNKLIIFNIGAAIALAAIILRVRRS